MAKKLRKRMPRARETRSISTDGTGNFSGIFSLESNAGVMVNPHNALTITAVWNAVNIYSNTIAGLDRFVAERGAMGGHSPAPDHPCFDLVRARPNRNMHAFAFFQTMVSHKKTYGNAYAEIVRKNRGLIDQLVILDPRNVQPRLDDKGNLWYRLEREGKDLAASEVVHFKGLGFDGLKGYSPITIARESIGLAMAENKFAGSTYGNGAIPNGMIKFPGDKTEEALSGYRKKWNRMHQGPDRAGSIGFLFAGAEWVQTAFSPADAQLILSRNFSVAEVARIFNLPQHMLGNLDKATFGNIEEQNIQFYQLSLMPELEEMEAELDLKLFGPRDRSKFFVHHDVGGLLRGNLAARTARDVAMFGIGGRTINQLLINDGLNPIANPMFDMHWVASNNFAPVELMDQTQPVPLDQADPDDVQDATPEEEITLPDQVDAERALSLAVDYSIDTLAGASQ